MSSSSSTSSSFNRLAVYGHRGWASSVIVASLAASGAPLKVLYRPGSDVSGLPEGVQAVEVDLADEDALVRALDDVDILLSLVGHSGVESQQHMVAAVARAPSVRLFVPSDLAARYDTLCTEHIPVNKRKAEVEEAARTQGVKTAVVLVGNFDAFALNTPAMGIDLPGNRVILTGDMEQHSTSLCTRDYAGAAYAQLFSRTPVDALAGRAITLREYTFSGSDLLAALARAHGGMQPTVARRTSVAELERAIAAGHPLALAYACRRNWGAGLALDVLTDDVLEVEGYDKATLEGQVVGGGLQHYRTLPPAFLTAAFEL